MQKRAHALIAEHDACECREVAIKGIHCLFVNVYEGSAIAVVVPELKQLSPVIKREH